MLYCGIDTGTHTGFAVWDSELRMFRSLETIPLHRALFRVAELAKDNDVCVIIEDARQRKWLPQERNVSESRGRLMGAGSVKRDAVIWEEFCKDYGIKYRMQSPQRGLTKWSKESFKAVTGWTGRTSKHARDAALLVFGRK